MTLSIKEGDLTVSVEIPNPDEQFDHAELLLMAALKAIGCCIGGGNAVRAYYHVDPDTLQLREDDEILWQLYLKYNLEAYKHIAEK